MNPSDSVRWTGAAPTWLKDYKCQGYSTNPTNGDILCDLGPMEAGYYDIHVMAAGSTYLAGGELVLDWRDAPNTGFIWYFFPMFYGTSIWSHVFTNIKIAVNERWRWRCGSNYTGIITTGLIAVRRA
jgi:hypothetical protein